MKKGRLYLHDKTGTLPRMEKLEEIGGLKTTTDPHDFLLQSEYPIQDDKC